MIENLKKIRKDRLVLSLDYNCTFCADLIVRISGRNHDFMLSDLKLFGIELCHALAVGLDSVSLVFLASVDFNLDFKAFDNFFG